MSIEGQKFYPGDEALPQQILALAEEFRRAADVVLTKAEGRDNLSRFPFRLLAIQAIELFLNAFLLASGIPAKQIRGWQHDLSIRCCLVAGRGLKLKKRTADHLRQLNQNREYLLIRYEPAPTLKLSEQNRLEATLIEVAVKVTAAFNNRK